MLTSKQRAHLRGLANSADTILQVGKEGIGRRLTSWPPPPGQMWCR